MAPSRDEVFEKVRNVLSDALGVDEDEVVPEATLQGDLGAESLDFLDIVFPPRSLLLSLISLLRIQEHRESKNHLRDSALSLARRCP